MGTSRWYSHLKTMFTFKETSGWVKYFMPGRKDKSSVSGYFVYLLPFGSSSRVRRYSHWSWAVFWWIHSSSTSNKFQHFLVGFARVWHIAQWKDLPQQHTKRPAMEIKQQWLIGLVCTWLFLELQVIIKAAASHNSPSAVGMDGQYE